MACATGLSAPHLEEHLVHAAATGLVEELGEQDLPEAAPALIRGDRDRLDVGDGVARERGQPAYPTTVGAPSSVVSTTT